MSTTSSYRSVRLTAEELAMRRARAAARRLCEELAPALGDRIVGLPEQDGFELSVSDLSGLGEPHEVPSDGEFRVVTDRLAEAVGDLPAQVEVLAVRLDTLVAAAADLDVPLPEVRQVSAHLKDLQVRLQQGTPGAAGGAEVRLLADALSRMEDDIDTATVAAEQRDATVSRLEEVFAAMGMQVAIVHGGPRARVQAADAAHHVEVEVADANDGSTEVRMEAVAVHDVVSPDHPAAGQRCDPSEELTNQIDAALGATDGLEAGPARLVVSRRGTGLPERTHQRRSRPDNREHDGPFARQPRQRQQPG